MKSVIIRNFLSNDNVNIRRFREKQACMSLQQRTGRRSRCRADKMYRTATVPFFSLFFITLFLSVNTPAQTISYPVTFRKKCAEIKEILILPAEFDCYHLTSGGIREYNDAMSIRSRDQIMKQVSEMLLLKGYSPTTLPDESFLLRNWRPLRHFYSVVNTEILRNVYGSSPFPDPLRHFSYSIPPIPDSLLYPTTDAVLFINGFDDRATDRRKGTAATAAVVTAVSVVTILVGGVGVVATVPPDQTFASCALVNREGKVIWYYRLHKTGNIDMTDGQDVKQFFETLLKKLTRESGEK